MQRLLDANGCVGCHAADKKIVGPSFREIAARYAGDMKAPSHLAQKIRQGGQGAWGNVPMPPNPGLSDADMHRLVAWLLQQK